MKPTIEDLQRLLLDARDEGQAEAPADPDPSYLIGCLQTCARFAHERARGGNWQALRLLALRALYLCALIAWEAGRRMSVGACARCQAPFAPAGHCSRRADGCQGGRGEVHASMFVNDGNGNGRLRPFEGPTAAETPAAKHDVEALLKLADDWVSGRNRQNDGMALLRDLAAALRAERERAEALASVARGRERASGLAIDAHRHLRAVLDFMWPVGGWMTSPTVVQKARAFLAGDGQAPLHDDAREIELLRKELADKGAALARMLERYEQARREVLTEDEAHAHTRARLAEVERDLAATKERLADAQHSFKRRADELDYLRAENRKALAAQNRAESEAAALRAQLVDLETAIRSLVDRVEKGRA
jgi:hypothetical protein